MKPKSQIIKRMDGIDLSSAGQTNAVVVEAVDEPKFIGSFTETETTEEYRSGYCGKNNQIVAQGMILYPWYGTAPNGVVIRGLSNKDISKLPDIPFYLDVDFNPYGVTYDYNSPDYTICDVKGYRCRFRNQIGTDSVTGAAYQNYDIEYKAYLKSTGEKREITWTIPTTEDGYVGFSFAWKEILPPGSEYTVIGDYMQSFEYGYALTNMVYKYKADGYYRFTNGQEIPVPFASMEEYNAALALTSVPQTMAVLNRVEV